MDFVQKSIENIKSFAEKIIFQIFFLLLIEFNIKEG